MSLDEFYSGFLKSLKIKGVPCVITGGLACVEFGIAEHTADCDVIFSPEHTSKFLGTLKHTSFHGETCHYRSLFSPPLDRRWLTGGYTCHFQWKTKTTENAYLDVFGVPPHITTPWQQEKKGFIAGRQTVAEMKRTNRRKDWDQATAIGLQMIERGDSRGWLHLFDTETLLSLIEIFPCGKNEISQRPVLKLVLEKNPLLERAVQTEIEFWTHLDRLRLKIYENSLRKYSSSLYKNKSLKHSSFIQQHLIRLEHAEHLLSTNPIGDYGIDRLVAEAKRIISLGIDPHLMELLPDARVSLSKFYRK